MCRRSSQLKIKLIDLIQEKVTIPINLLKQLQANFNLQFVYAALNMLRNLDSWSVTLGNVSYVTNIFLSAK